MNETGVPATRWREYGVHAVLLALLLVPVFPNVFFRGHTVSSAYILLEFNPWKQYASPSDFPHDEAILTWEYASQWIAWWAVANRAMRSGEWPLWDPLQNTGVPLLANYQSAFFYPPRIVHAFMDVHWAGTLCILFKVWLTGFTAYAFARCIGLGINASRFLSAAWMLGVFNMTWTFWNEVDVSAWLPVQMMGVEALFHRRWRRGFFLVAIAATMILFAGHPETAFTTSMGAGLYLVCRLVIANRLRLSRYAAPLTLALGAWVLALLVVAVQVVPFFEYLLNSWTFAERHASDEAMHSLTPQALVAFWAPRFFGITHTPTHNYWGFWTHSAYTSIVYPGLAVWFGVLALAVALREGTEHRARIVALAVPALLCSLLLFDHPIVDAFRRVPVVGATWRVWFVPFLGFALATSGAIGVQRWFERPRGLREVLLVALPAAIITVGIAAFYVAHHRPLHVLEGKGTERFVQREIIMTALFCTACTIVFALPWIRSKSRAAGVLATLLLVTDLVVAGRGLRPTTPREYVFMDTALTRWLQEQQPARCALGSRTSAAIPDGIIQYYGIEDLFGYDGIFPERIMRLRSAGINLWNCLEPVFSVKYYLNTEQFRLFVPPERMGQFKWVTTLDGLEVYENTKAWDRVALVASARVEPDPEAQFHLLDDESFDPARTALLERPLPAPLTEGDSSDPGMARFVGRTMNTVTVEADVNRRSILVLADQYFPGWNAYVDGVRTEVFPVYYVFRGVLLEPGQHTVVFRYEPSSFRIGMAISVATLVAGAAAGVYALSLAGRARTPRGAG